MAKAKSELTSKQNRALATLATGVSIEDAALVASVHPATIYKWMKRPAFMAELRQMQSNASTEHVVALSSELRRNRVVMVAARDDIEAPWHVRLRAATALEDSLLRWKQAAEFEERLAALEASIAQ